MVKSGLSAPPKSVFPYKKGFFLLGSTKVGQKTLELH